MSESSDADTLDVVLDRIAGGSGPDRITVGELLEVLLLAFGVTLAAAAILLFALL